MNKYMKKGLVVLISVMLVVTSVLGFAIGTSAAQTNKAGDKAAYKFDSKTGTLTISGEGPMYNFRATNLLGTKAPWQDSKPNIKKVVIEEGITYIGQYAFYNCTALTDVTIPSSVEEIGGLGDMTTSYGAFQGCTALTYINIPSGVKLIDNCAFKGCTSLKTVVLGNALEKIDYGAFTGCSAITGITFPDSMTSLAQNAFRDCKALSTVTYGKGMSSTGVYSFYQSGVKKINFSETINTIDTYCFYGCPISSIDIPETVTAINIRAFGDTYYLNSATINNPNTEFNGIIGEDPFNAGERQVQLTIRGHKGSTAETYATEKGYKFQSIDACDHLNTKQVTSVEPTCTTTGIMQTICNDCGNVIREEVVQALGHKYDITDFVDETNINGHITYQYTCATCKDSYETAEHQRTNASEDDESSLRYIWIGNDYTYENSATCTRPGIETYTCTFFNCTQKERHISAANNHKVKQWETISEATCTEDGLRGGVCSECGEDVEETIKALGHTIDEENYDQRFDNTADDGHFYNFYTCQVCHKEVIKSEHVDWIEGNYTPFVASEAHCVISGLERDTCDICGETRTIILPANGQHEWYVRETTEPTCTAVGKIYYSCENCTLEKSDDIEALGHDYVLQESSSRAPTCTVVGFDTYKCSRCSASKQEAIPATGHTVDEEVYVVSKQPTCESGGSATSVCTVCESRFAIELEALGHDYKPVRKKLTAQPGHSHTTPTCTRCGATDAAFIEHESWEDGMYTVETITEPGCVVQGRVRFTCTYCAETLTEYTPALGHIYNATGTITNNDNISYRCTLCNTFTLKTPVEIFAMWDNEFILMRDFNRTGVDNSSFVDVDGNGYINARDYLLLKKLSEEYVIKHPVEPEPEPEPEPVE